MENLFWYESMIGLFIDFEARINFLKPNLKKKIPLITTNTTLLFQNNKVYYL